jgi:hypothetical protein
MMSRKSFYSHVATTVIFFLMMSIVVCYAVPVLAGSPVIFYSDLVSGPNTGGENNNGAFVTIWGRNFGNSQGASFVTVGGGSVDNYREWSDTRICFQLGHNAKTGAISVTTSEGTGVGDIFTVRTTGTIYFVDINASSGGDGSFSSPWDNPHVWYINMSAGDICYFREGIYPGQYGDKTGGYQWVFNTSSCNQGTETNPIAFVAYPGETVVFDASGSNAPTSNFGPYWQNDFPDWIVISKFNLKAYNQCVGSAGMGCRIVGNDCEGLTTGDCPQMGSIGVNRKGWVLGNKIHGGRTHCHYDHAIYIGGCPYSGNVYIGWNHIYDNDFDYGPLVSINMEGTRCGEGEYVKNIYFYNNIIDSSSYPCRGLVQYLLGYTSDEPKEQCPAVYIYNNQFIECGMAGHAALTVENGKSYIYNNTFYNTKGDQYAVYLLAASTGNSNAWLYDAEVVNNIIHVDSGVSNYIRVDTNYPRDGVSKVVLSNNCYFGDGPFAGTTGHTDPHSINADPKFMNPEGRDFSLQSDSLCLNTGISIVSPIVINDINGVPRPQGGEYDIGAYEYGTGSSPPPPDDDTPPLGSIQINNGATETSSSNVTLNLSASDSQSGVSQMQFSNNNEDWSAPEFYATSKNWVLSNGLGNKTVYVKFKNGAGNWSSSYNDTIEVVDVTPPGDVSNIRYSIGDGGSVSLNWSNPSDIDFAGTMVRYGVTGYPADYGQGILFCNRQMEPGSNDEYNATLPEGIYYFSFFTYDARANYSQAVHLIVTVSTSGEVYSKVFGDTDGAAFPGTIEDTYININSDNNFNSINLNTYTWPADSVANAILMKINLGGIPEGAQIQNATLYVYMNGADNDGGDDLYDVSVHKIINHNPLLAQCTGYTYDGTNSWTPNDKCYNNVPMAQADIAEAEDSRALDKNIGYKSWNVTNMVRDWVQNSAPNYGLLLNSDSTAGSSSNRTFLSSEASEPAQRPKLVVTYSVSGGSAPDTTPPSAPTGLGVH